MASVADLAPRNRVSNYTRLSFLTHSRHLLKVFLHNAPAPKCLKSKTEWHGFSPLLVEPLPSWPYPNPDPSRSRSPHPTRRFSALSVIFRQLVVVVVVAGLCASARAENSLFIWYFLWLLFILFFFLIHTKFAILSCCFSAAVASESQASPRFLISGGSSLSRRRCLSDERRNYGGNTKI